MCIFYLCSIYKKNVCIKKQQSGTRLSVTAVRFWILSFRTLLSVASLSVSLSICFCCQYCADFGIFSIFFVFFFFFSLVFEPQRCKYSVREMKINPLDVPRLCPFPFYRPTSTSVDGKYLPVQIVNFTIYESVPEKKSYLICFMAK